MPVRLTDERFTHILEHPEMADRGPAIAETLRQPDHVMDSLAEPQARLYYRFYTETLVGDKYVCEERTADMARDRIRVWYDAEGDYLEVIFDQRKGIFRPTANDQVMEKVDAEGNILGFSVMKVSTIRSVPLEIAL